ncbi:MAG: (d)CMP kinase [Candidatus Eisenbacteria bacterium]|nr:(d)CMP kinase [Candidatus Eisenbacteria bacterium]
MFPVIAIDGPAGVGKSSTAREVARRLGFVYLDSGALYRAFALAASRKGLDQESLSAQEGIERLLRETELRAEPEAERFRVWVDGLEATGDLRSPEAGARASLLATQPAVRARVGKVLRELAGRHPSVVEGRDMGTTVFPEARLKIFLTASLDARVARRKAQLEREGTPVDEGAVRAGIVERDRRDSERDVSPLRPAPDSIRLDTTRLALTEQVDIILALYAGGGHIAGPAGYRAVQWSSRAIMRFLFGMRVQGAETLPKGAFLLASNHKSYLDPPLIGAAAPMMIGFLAKEELFRIPLLGAWIRSLQAIPIRRGEADRRGLERALAHLSRAVPLAVFPEGTRIPGEELGQAHPGIALLAKRSRAPVVPARILGSGHAWRALFLRRGLRVVFGSPMAPPDSSGAEAARRYAERVMQAIGDLEAVDCGKPHRAPPNPGR